MASALAVGLRLHLSGRILDSALLEITGKLEQQLGGIVPLTSGVLPLIPTRRIAVGVKDELAALGRVVHLEFAPNRVGREDRRIAHAPVDGVEIMFPAVLSAEVANQLRADRRAADIAVVDRTVAVVILAIASLGRALDGLADDNPGSVVALALARMAFAELGASAKDLNDAVDLTVAGSIDWRRIANTSEIALACQFVTPGRHERRLAGRTRLPAADATFVAIAVADVVVQAELDLGIACRADDGLQDNLATANT